MLRWFIKTQSGAVEHLHFLARNFDFFWTEVFAYSHVTSSRTPCPLLFRGVTALQLAEGEFCFFSARTKNRAFLASKNTSVEFSSSSMVFSWVDHFRNAFSFVYVHSLLKNRTKNNDTLNQLKTPSYDQSDGTSSSGTLCIVCCWLFKFQLNLTLTTIHFSHKALFGQGILELVMSLENHG